MSGPGLKKLLVAAQDMAGLIDGTLSKVTPGEHRGMGAVTLLFHPYERMWIAKVDWSDGSKIESPTWEDPLFCVQDLIKLLEKER